jgi:hypothetical protein
LTSDICGNRVLASKSASYVRKTPSPKYLRMLELIMESSLIEYNLGCYLLLTKILLENRTRMKIK